MKINKKKYSFAYTVGVACAREERNIAKMSQTKSLIELALLMNEAYEKREKYYNPNHEMNLLDRDELLMQDDKIIPVLDKELSEVFQRDSRVSVLTSPDKKKVEDEVKK